MAMANVSGQADTPAGVGYNYGVNAAPLNVSLYGLWGRMMMPFFCLGTRPKLPGGVCT